MDNASQDFKVENLAISTATIEIKTITLNRKRLTQSVFRQIQEEPVFSVFSMWNNLGKNTPPTECLRGNVLGFVNYFWKEAQGELHILWEWNGKLRRSLLAPTSTLRWKGTLETIDREEQKLFQKYEKNYQEWCREQADEELIKPPVSRHIFYVHYFAENYDWFDYQEHDHFVLQLLRSLEPSFLGQALRREMLTTKGYILTLEDLWLLETYLDESPTERLWSLRTAYYRLLKYLKQNTEQLFIAT